MKILKLQRWKEEDVEDSLCFMVMCISLMNAKVGLWESCFKVIPVLYE